MYLIPKTIWRPDKVVSFPIKKRIGNVRTTGEGSIWKIIKQAMFTSFIVAGTFF